MTPTDATARPIAPVDTAGGTPEPTTSVPPVATGSPQPSYHSLPHETDSPRNLGEFDIEIPAAPPLVLLPPGEQAWRDLFKQLSDLTTPDGGHPQAIAKAVRRCLSEAPEAVADRTERIFNALGGNDMARWCLDEMIRTIDDWPHRVVIDPVPDQAQAAAAARRRVMDLLAPHDDVVRDLAELLRWLRDETALPPSLTLSMQVLVSRIYPLAPGPHLDAMLAPLADPKSDPACWPSLARCICNAEESLRADVMRPLVAALLARIGSDAETDAAVGNALSQVLSHISTQAQGGEGAHEARQAYLDAHRAVLRQLRQQCLADPGASTQWAGPWLLASAGAPNGLDVELAEESLRTLLVIAGPAPQSSGIAAAVIDPPVGTPGQATLRERLMTNLMMTLNPGANRKALAAACLRVETLAPQLFPGAIEFMLERVCALRMRASADAPAEQVQDALWHEQRLLATLVRLAGTLSLEQFAAAVRGHAMGDWGRFRPTLLASAGDWAREEEDDWGAAIDPDYVPVLQPIRVAVFAVRYYAALVEQLQAADPVKITPAHLGALSCALEHALLTRPDRPHDGTLHHLGALLSASHGLRTEQLEAMAVGLLAVHVGLLHHSTGPADRLNFPTLRGQVEKALRTQPDARDADGQPAAAVLLQALKRLSAPEGLLVPPSGKDSKAAAALDEPAGHGLRDLVAQLPARIGGRAPLQLHTALKAVEQRDALPRAVRDSLLLSLARDRRLPTDPQAFQALHRAMLRMYVDSSEEADAAASRETKHRRGVAPGDAGLDGGAMRVDTAVLMQLYDGMETPLAITEVRRQSAFASGSRPTLALRQQWRQSLEVLGEAIDDVRVRFEADEPALCRALTRRLEGMRHLLDHALAVDKAQPASNVDASVHVAAQASADETLAAINSGDFSAARTQELQDRLVKPQGPQRLG